MITRRLVLATTKATGATLAVGTVPTAARPTPRTSSARQVLAIAGRPGTIETPGFPGPPPRRLLDRE